MWTSRLFWKIFLISTGLNLAAVTVFGVFFLGSQVDQVIQDATRQLNVAAVLLRSFIESEWRPENAARLQAMLRKRGEESGLRMTLVFPDGTVLADSHRDPVGMENHLNLPEMAGAAKRGSGSARRASPISDVEMLFYAIRAEQGGRTVGLVRVAMPVDAIQDELDATRGRFFTIAAVVCLGGIVFSFWLSAQFVRPVIRLNQASRAIAGGDYLHRVYVDYRNELGQLGESFNQMVREMAQREGELRDSGQRLATVLGGMIEGVIAVDAHERVLFANDAAANLFGFDAADAQGKAFLETLRNHTLHKAVSQALATGQPRQLETELGGSRQLTLHVHATPLPGYPCPGVVLVLHDISDLRRLEQLRQEFVANVSHELKTPLSSIKAYAETLRTGAIHDDEINLEFVKRIEEQADRLHELILDVLALARIESGGQAFEMASVSISKMAQEVVESHREVATNKQIKLAVPPDVEPLSVWADQEGMRQILDNLVDNALKYSPEGGRVSISWRRQQNWAILDVEDTGIGIPEEHQARIFERFYRVDKARSRELGGTGLGLSIVKHLARAFGGTASVSSKPGKGSKFTVKLPLSKSSGA